MSSQPIQTSSTSSSQFTTKLFTRTDLLEQANTNNEIVNLINDAFRQSKVPVADAWDLTATRFPPNADPVNPGLANLLGDDGICAIVCDGDRVVATASAIPWPDYSRASISSESAKHNAGLDWEIKCVASLFGTEYRGKGLASRACAAVEEALISRLNGEGRLERPRLWIYFDDGTNGAYWRRRGYTEIIKLVPRIGTWGSRKEFTVVVSLKVTGADSEEGLGFALDREKLRLRMENHFGVGSHDA